MTDHSDIPPISDIPSTLTLRIFDDSPKELLTNFHAFELPYYKEAVRQYSITNPEIKLTIGIGWKDASKYGLYMYSDRELLGEDGLSPFWELFTQFGQSIGQSS